MQRKKEEDRKKAQDYQFDDGTTGKQFMEALSGEIRGVMQELRKQRDKVSGNQGILFRISIETSLTELLEAIGSLQQGYGQVISQKIETDERATLQQPIEFEDRVKRVKSAIKQAESYIATAQRLHGSEETFIQAILWRIAMIFNPKSQMNELVKKLDNLARQVKDKKSDIPLRFFLPKPPEPTYPRKEAKHREAKLYDRKTRK